MTVTELKVRITGDASGGIKALEDTARAQNQARISADAMADAMERLEREIQLAGDSSAEAAAQYETLSGSLKELSDAEKAAVIDQARARDAAIQEADAKAALIKVTQDLEREIKLSGNESAAAAVKFDTERGSLAALSAEEKEQVVQLARLADAHKTLMASIQEAPAALQGFGMSMSMYGTLPILAMGGASAVMSSQFEDSMAKIVGLADVPQAMADRWKTSIDSISDSTGRMPVELANAMYFVASAGLKGSAAVDTLDKSAKGAAIGMGDTKVIADAATSAINAYGQSNMTAAHALDVMVATVREGKMPSEELAGALGRVLPIAAQMDVSFENVGASIAAMTREGLSADEATTALRQTLATMLHPSKQTAEALDLVHLKASDLRKEMSENLFTALVHISTAFDGNDEALSRVFPNIRALTGVLNLTGKSADEVARIFQDVEHSTGSLDKAFAIASKTTGFQFRQSIADLGTAAIQLGDTLAPLTKEIAADIRSLADEFRALSPEQKETIVHIAEFVAVVGPATLMIGKLVGAIKLWVETTAAINAWALGAKAALGAEGVVGAAEGATAELGVLRGALAALTSTPWTISIAIVAGGAVVAYDELTMMAHGNDWYNAQADKSLAAHGFESPMDKARRLHAQNPNFNAEGLGVTDAQYQQILASDRNSDAAYDAGEARKYALSTGPIPMAPLPPHKQGGGGGGGGGKPHKETDAERDLDQYRDQIYDLTKAIALNGNESESAGLQYDILHGHLDGVSKSMQEYHLHLLNVKEAQESARDAAKKFNDAMDEQRNKIRELTGKSTKDQASRDLFGVNFNELNPGHFTRPITSMAQNQAGVLAGKMDMATGIDADQKQRKANSDLGTQLEVQAMVDDMNDQLAQIQSLGKSATLGLGSGLMEIAKDMEHINALAKERNDLFAQTAAGMRTEIDTMDLSTDTEKLDYQLKSGNLKDLSKAQKDYLVQVEKELDLKKQIHDAEAQRKQDVEQMVTDTQQSVTKGFNDLFRKGVKGFFNDVLGGWSNMLTSMAEKWLQSQLQQILSRNLDGLFNMAQNWLNPNPSGAGGGGASGNAITYAGGFVGAALYADGGDVAPNIPIVVGDGGRPEVFVPRSAGTIVPSVGQYQQAATATHAGDRPMVIHQNFRISTPNPGAFRYAESTIRSRSASSAQRAMARNK